MGGGSNTWVGNESAADSLDIGCNCNNRDKVQGKKSYEQMVFLKFLNKAENNVSPLLLMVTKPL